MFLSDICSRTATGGILAMVAGRRVTSAFMSLSSSSNCFSTERERERERGNMFNPCSLAQNCHETHWFPIRGGVTRGRGMAQGRGMARGRGLARGRVLLTFVQHSVGRLVPGHGLLAEVLVGLGQTLHLAEARVQGHGGMGGVLRHVEVGRPPQLLLDHQSLLQ